MYLTELVCGLCGKEHPKDEVQTVCHACSRPLLARYDLAAVAAAVAKDQFAGRPASLWRYRELLPLGPAAEPVTLGEGWTPLLAAPRLARSLGLERVWIKDESQNPTGTFKARGMAVAVSMAKHLGLQALAAPSAGNAGAALAAYAARGGLKAYLFMPKDTPKANVIECVALGAEVVLLDGFITDCAKEVARRKEHEGWFDVSTLKEPYRVEGKKTLGLELAEQLDWELPDVILYPTGGGTGLVGMWKAFAEMEQLGWISSRRPRMVAVQAAGCQPIATALSRHQRFAEEHPHPSTKAAGLRVPKAIGDFLILDAIRASKGTSVPVTDDEMVAAAGSLGAAEGLFAAPEGAACCAALARLRQSGWVRPEESVVIFNTGTGLKYLECYAQLRGAVSGASRRP